MARSPMTVAGKSLRAIGRVVATAWVVAFLAWGLGEVSPGDTQTRAARCAGFSAALGEDMNEAMRAQMTREVAAELGVHPERGQRFASFASGLLRLDFGTSWRHRVPARPLIAAGLPKTAVLCSLALLLAMLLGVGAATWTECTTRSFARRAVSGSATVFISVPPIWLGLLTMSLLAAGKPLAILPSGGDSALGFVLPVLTLAALPAAFIFQHTRSVMRALATEPWATSILARGISRHRLYWVHLLRAAAPRLVPLAVAITGYMLGASAVLEMLFEIRGLGPLLVGSATIGDTPVLIGLCAFYAAVIASVAAIVDILRPRLDPRLASGLDHA